MEEAEKLTEKPGYYAVIPASIRYDKSLSPNAKLLYGEITALLNFKNKCFASNAYFSRLYEISQIQVSRLISQLANSGYITTEMEITAKGSQRLIKTVLNINDNTPIIKKVNTGINKKVKHNNQSFNNPSLFKDKEDVCFEDFWNLYNKKVGKKEAEKIWDKLAPKIRLKIMLILTAWLKQFISKQFTPNPATFLNGELWNDEIIAVEIKSHGKYPDNFSLKFQDTLQGSDLSGYWTHLRSLGLVPKKDRFEKTIDWVKA